MAQMSVSLAPLTGGQLTLLFAGRLATNTAFRLVYPLLALLAAGLAVDLRTASLLVTVQVAAALLSPLGGRLADTYGELVVMKGGLALFCLGAGVCALAYSFGPFLVGYSLIGLGTTFHSPASIAYASARTPYARRGRILGILELSWALAALVGVTGLARLIEARESWAPAFWVLLGVGLLVVLTMVVVLPAAPHMRAVAANDSDPVGRASLVQPGVVAVIAMMGFLACALVASELVFVVYASWLQADFGATTEQIGFVFGLLGLVELAGSAGSAVLVDRMGKRRTVLLAFAATAVVQVLLPLSSGSWLVFLPLFLLFDLCFEFAIVSVFPLISGIAPAARGTMLALGTAAIGLGRVIGSLVGPVLWQQFGFVANGLLAGGLTLLGVVICYVFVREGEESDTHL
ncbi:MAG TPA: MFS transporter [Roseiflexaceae bacterium]|nr:MFS transporter [Roseiflexaceae bacterium]